MRLIGGRILTQFSPGAIRYKTDPVLRENAKWPILTSLELSRKHAKGQRLKSTTALPIPRLPNDSKKNRIFHFFKILNANKVSFEWKYDRVLSIDYQKIELLILLNQLHH